MAGTPLQLRACFMVLVLLALAAVHGSAQASTTRVQRAAIAAASRHLQVTVPAL
jgi:hypothetical protein